MAALTLNSINSQTLIEKFQDPEYQLSLIRQVESKLAVNESCDSELRFLSWRALTGEANIASLSELFQRITPLPRDATFIIEGMKVDVSCVRLINVSYFESFFSPKFEEGRRLRKEYPLRDGDPKPEFKLEGVSARIFKIWFLVLENNPLAEITPDDFQALQKYNDCIQVNTDEWLRSFIRTQFRFLDILEIFQMGVLKSIAPCLNALPREMVQQEAVQAILRIFPQWVKRLEGCKVSYEPTKIPTIKAALEAKLNPDQKEAFLQVKRFFPFSAAIDRIDNADLSELPEEVLIWILSLISQKATHLDLSCTQLRKCRILGWFQQLQVLNFSHCTQLTSIKALKQCKNLTRLTLTGCSDKIKNQARSSLIKVVLIE